MKEKLIQVDIELRSLSEKIKDGSMKAEDAQNRLEELKVQKRGIEQEIALASAPINKEERSIALADVKDAMIEKRAITLNGTGAINQIRELQKELSRKREILNNVRYFYGPNAATNIPVLSPSLATPGAFAEGSTSIPNDAQAALGVRQLTPNAFVSILPVSAETLALGSFDFESELPSIFAEAFAEGFASQVLTGSGTGLNFQGIFTGNTNTIPCAMTGVPRVMDLVNLALTVKDFTDDAFIVLHPNIYSGIMSDSTTGLAELYKEELIRNKTVEGVKVLLTGFAPNSVVSGSTVAVAYRARDYAFGLASEIQIEPIKVVGSTQTYFQAMVFANGRRILDTNYFALTTI